MDLIMIKVKKIYKNNNKNTYVESLVKEINNITSDWRYNTAIHIMYSGSLYSKYIDFLLSPYNITGAGLQILYTLILQNGNSKPKDLSKLTFRSKQNLNRIINGLVKNGMVSRQKNNIDRRCRNVAVTKKGLALIEVILPLISEELFEVIKKCNEGDIQQLRDTLKTIRRSLYKQFDIKTIK